MSLNMHFSFFALSPFTKNNSFVWFRAWNITKTRWKIDFYDQQWYHATLRIVQVFFSHRGTTAVYDNSIFQLSFSKIMKVKIKRIDKHSSFLLFYVSIRRQITRIIVLSLLSRLHETALLSIRSNINFPIPHQTMTEKMGNAYLRKRSNVVIMHKKYNRYGYHIWNLNPYKKCLSLF